MSASRQIDEICDEFEAEWNSGDSVPSIPRYLKRLTNAGKDAVDQLLEALVTLDVELRIQRGQAVRSEQYKFLGHRATSVAKLAVAEARQAIRNRSGGETLSPDGPPDTGSGPCDGDARPRSERLPGDSVPLSSSSQNTNSAAIPDQVRHPRTIGRYQVRSVLGQGGFATVYRAWDPQLERDVALKVPHAELVANLEIRKRFLIEARAIAGLRHRGLCRIHSIEELPGGQPVLCLEYIHGKPLSKLIAGKPMKPEVAARIAVRIANALQSAHDQGILHRDLKPDNILISSNGFPVVTDFGLARRSVGDHRTQSGSIFGTPAYMPPEQARGETDNIGVATDIYSLGVTLFEMLTGSVPFGGSVSEVVAMVLRDPPPPPSAVYDKLGQAWDTICLKAMDKRPDRRYASMNEFAAAVDNARRKVPSADNRRIDAPVRRSRALSPKGDPAAEAVLPPRRRSVRRTPPKSARKRSATGLRTPWQVTAGLCLLLALAGGLFLLNRQPDQADSSDEMVRELLREREQLLARIEALEQQLAEVQRGLQQPPETGSAAAQQLAAQNQELARLVRELTADLDRFRERFSEQLSPDQAQELSAWTRLVADCGRVLTRHRMWVYNDRAVASAAGRRRLVADASGNVFCAYVSVYQVSENADGRRMFDTQEVGDLLKLAHERDIRVWACYGAEDWADLVAADPVNSFPVQRIRELLEFNAGSPHAFDGLMLNVNPVVADEKLLHLFRRVSELCHAERRQLPVAVAAQFHWDQSVPFAGRTATIIEHTIDMIAADELDHVVVMAYRDLHSEIIELVESELRYAQQRKIDGRMLLGVETQAVKDGNVTFFEEGPEFMAQELAELAGRLSGNRAFGGWAIHNYRNSYLDDSWMKSDSR